VLEKGFLKWFSIISKLKVRKEINKSCVREDRMILVDKYAAFGH
jgi:hypothetical protein